MGVQAGVSGEVQRKPMGVEGEDGAGGGRGAKGEGRWAGDRRYRGRKREREEEEGGRAAGVFV
jgi:hypothetical protein